MRTYFLYFHSLRVASLVQKKRKVFEILWSKKKIFLAYVRNTETPSPLVRNRTHLAWPFPSPLVRKYYVDYPKLWVIIFTFEEVISEKLVGGLFSPLPRPK